MKKLKLFNTITIPTLLLVLFFGFNEGVENADIKAQSRSWHILMLESELHRNPEAWTLYFRTRPQWNYTHGLVLMAAMRVYEETQDQRYWNYIKDYYDFMMDDEGNIGHNFRLRNFNIDHIKPGINLFDLYEKTKDKRYLTALQTLRQQLRETPRTNSGGFWHKRIYPYQLWLDGVYMHAPFYSRYGKVFNEPENFDDVLAQMLLVYESTRDKETGLLFHAYDESRQMAWANPETGHSPSFWGRAMGWYAMALVDVLDYFPADHPGRPKITQILKKLIDALLVFQDKETGLWYQVVDQGDREGNYLEASASIMFTYALIKAINDGLIGNEYLQPTKKAWQGILDNFIDFDEDGFMHLHQTCGVAGLGGNPFRDGSFEYYISEPINSNNPKSVGPFILLSMEMVEAGIILTKNK